MNTQIFQPLGGEDENFTNKVAINEVTMATGMDYRQCRIKVARGE